MMRELSEMRKDIDRVDEGLKALFEERIGLSLEIADFKKEHDLPIYDKKREEEMLDKLSKDYEDPFMKESIRELFNCLIKISKRLQEKTIKRGEDQA